MNERLKRMYSQIKTNYQHIGIEKFKTLDLSTVDGKRELIDCFINSIYVYDDKLVLTFNYKDGTRTVLMSELENTPKSSDIKMSRAPTKGHGNIPCFFVRQRGEKNLYGCASFREAET